MRRTGPSSNRITEGSSIRRSLFHTGERCAGRRTALLLRGAVRRADAGFNPPPGAPIFVYEAEPTGEERVRVAVDEGDGRHGRHGHRHIEELLTLKTIAETLNRSTDLHEMLQQVLKSLIQVTRLQTGWLFLVGEPPHFTCVAHHAAPPALAADGARRLKEGLCYCLHSFWRGALKEAVNVIKCERIESAIAEGVGSAGGIRHHASVPIMVRGRPIGLLNVAAPRKAHFEPEELALLEAVAYQIGNAVERVRLTVRREELARAEERRRLARDLHDAVSQALFSLRLTASGAQAVIDEDPEAARQALQAIEALAQEAQREMRALIWQLRPPALEEGLLQALQRYGESLGLQVEAEASFEPGPLPAAAEEALLRIGQEALNNVRKHATGREARLRLERSGQGLRLEVENSGPPGSVESLRETGLGLKSMRERAEALGGSFAAVLPPNGGVRVQAWIPLAADREPAQPTAGPATWGWDCGDCHPDLDCRRS